MTQPIQLINQVYKTVPGLDNVKVNRNGEVIKLTKNGCRVLKPFINRAGYLTVRICSRNKYKNKRVHRLVALAFIPNPAQKPEVNHKNGIKTDNNVSNLEWCTPQENSIHSVKNKLFVQRSGPESKMSKKIIQKTRDGEFVREWIGIRTINRETGYKRASITNSCTGKCAHAYGFKWEYA